MKRSLRPSSRTPLLKKNGWKRARCLAEYRSTSPQIDRLYRHHRDGSRRSAVTGRKSSPFLSRRPHQPTRSFFFFFFSRLHRTLVAFHLTCSAVMMKFFNRGSLPTGPLPDPFTSLTRKKHPPRHTNSRILATRSLPTNGTISIIISCSLFR